MTLSHSIKITSLSAENGGGFTALAPELFGCRSDGEAPDEALANTYDAIACWIEAARDMGRTVPVPKRVAE